MLIELALFFTLASVITTFTVMAGRLIRSPVWVGLPVGLVILGAAGWLTGVIAGDRTAAVVLPIAAIVALALVRLLFRRWSTLAAQLFATASLASASYLVYAGLLPFVDRLSLVGVAASLVLLLLEAFALALSLYYLFEILDVFSRRTRSEHLADGSYRPKVAIQVPCYNEPVEVMRETLTALQQLDYPDVIVQVVDNNTKDPKVWGALEKLCQELGPRFAFIHLEPWPGYKAGALNEATRRLPKDVSILAIVDADYIVKPNFLKATVGHFADERVGFVQTPQDYRDWKDSGYLRGLYYSYRYFFDVTMPARANRNAIIFAGTMGLIRRAAFDSIGGWNQEIITEDAEASLRMLGEGAVGIYVPTPFGQGLMPLDFDGLKKQRYRWALGGIQILRRWWRELVPFLPHRLRLTFGQRIQYLAGSVHWFGDLLTAVFTFLLVLTAVAAVMHHRLPIREITGPVLVVPLAFLVTGVLRGLWALRRAEHSTWGDALRALGIWFALSWVDTLAVVRGLISGKAAFLRTPKQKEGGSRLWPAIRSSATESLFAGLAALAAIVMVIAAPAIATGILAIMLLFEAWVFASAPWASFAAEGIQLTPYRQIYRRSAQNTGDRPQRASPADLVPAALAVVVAVVLAYGLLNAPPENPTQPQLPTLGTITQPKTGPPATPAATATPAPTPITTPSPSPSPSGTVSPSSG
ncbi:MAG TPA: glycosyltransferase family 2 protein [Candidatus Dormibacteraeota bacterium]|nr:glycosyltransferase family 2 protein [Candidatus Dormibacteraeota bacterium]